MPYGNKTQDKVLTGQGRLTHWKKDKGPKKQKEVEDKSPEAPGIHKKKKRSPKPGKQPKIIKIEDRTVLASKKQSKMDQEKVNEKKMRSPANHLGKWKKMAV